MVSSVALDDLRFDRPIELAIASQRYERDVVDAAARRGVTLDAADVGAAVRAAVDAGTITTVSVTLPGLASELHVLDLSTFVDGMEAFFDAEPDYQPAPPAAASDHRNRVRRWAWRAPARWVIERVWRTPAAVCR